MVELRKRKAPAEPAPPPAPKKNSNPVKKAVDKAKEAVTGEPAKTANGAGKLAVGDTVPLDGFGGEIETHSGEKTTLKKLVDDSKAGVVLFTYPKASTPGCEYSLFLLSLFFSGQEKFTQSNTV
jgi:thioredoxin-dependent peroxiredoxin